MEMLTWCLRARGDVGLGLLAVCDAGPGASVQTLNPQQPKSTICNPYFTTAGFLKPRRSLPVRVHAQTCGGLGCLLCELRALEHSFKANLAELLVHVMKAEFKPAPPHYSADLQTLLGSLLAWIPADSPTLAALLMRPALRSAKRVCLHSCGPR